MKTLYLMRHGQTEFNVQKIVQGQCDSPLTTAGKDQAREAALKLAQCGVCPDRIVASPLGRAYRTCVLVRDVLCESLGVALPEVETCQDLEERNYGSFERGLMSEVPADVWNPGEELVSYGAEGSAALRVRIVEAIRNLMAPDEVGTFLAVSHGSAVLQFYLAAERPGESEPRRRLPNCCVLKFSYDESASAFTLLEVL
ncbi:MAG: phosphoglycerate mutase family protein [Collinsella bouchesdurhonensis]|nr:phosphoglycerate mutase family protein [Collinsella bouchesdurhonensis]